ncbi:MAG: DNA mismatch repair endonuclease MutL [Anaerolineales bacterium]|nr:DNA mismatch repair endonuclease MutL [Anaerolineales bacterium]
MTRGIRVLSPQLSSQIAAGEVVERPASVVKELLENALDAGARTISIETEEGGNQKIVVADDGDGIAPDEISLALARHATSKLASIEDLDTIRTLGFRGEALASIAAVARVQLTSRSRAGSSGMRLKAENGRAGKPSPVGAPQGTVILVEDLFFNVPARRKFLKSRTTERRLIEALAARYALAYPSVRFRLVQDGRESFSSTGSGDRREVLAALFGVDAAQRMIDLSAAEMEGPVRVSGFVSPTDLSRSNRRDILLFVNGRSIADPALTTAVVQAYHTLLMVGRFPFGAVFIEMPPEDVDVNVHPAKAEVRFRSPDAVFSAVQRAVRQALLRSAGSSGVPAAAPWPTRTWATGGGSGPGPDWMLDHAPDPSGMDSANSSAGGAPVLPAGEIPLLRPVGQIGSAYLVAEGPDGLYLIDQHAAHERVLFEAMRREQTGAHVSQRLLAPEIVDLPALQASALNDQLEMLRQIGFDVEPFGGSSFRVRSVPQLLGALRPEDALRAVVEDFEEDETPLAAETEARLIARICKRAAVKAGQALGPEEQAALVRALEACASPRTCPHGRPTMIHLPMDLLARRFGRK